MQVQYFLVLWEIGVMGCSALELMSRYISMLDNASTYISTYAEGSIVPRPSLAAFFTAVEKRAFSTAVKKATQTLL